MSSADIPWWRRLFAPANVLSVVAGVVVFILGLVAWDTNRGVLVSAVVAAAVTGIVWLIWWSVSGPPNFARLLGVPLLGSIPNDASGPAPTLADARSHTSVAYGDLLGEIEGYTSGQVLLVSSPGPGQGASTVALNLAVSATQRGRRVALIDGDVAGNGVSRFLSTGPEPGLTDLADGSSTLAESARMWEIGPDSVLPIVPSGSQGTTSEDGLAGPDLAAPIDQIAERADAVFIDAPPIARDEATASLAAHADGTILVVTDAATDSTVVDTRDRLDAAGAPAIGYVENRTKPPSFWRLPVVRMLKRAAGAFVAIALVYSGFIGYQLNESWSGVDRQALDTSEAEVLLPPTSAPPPADIVDDDPEVPPLEEVVVAAPTIEGAYRSLLLIGSDEAADLADVILLTVLPADSELDPFMVSLPRDLYVPNRCTDSYSRINATLRECGEVSPTTMLALTVEDFTGIKVNNFALFDFDGFAEVIDGVGGVEICADYPMRDEKSHLDFPGGCVNADGVMALAWVRSRHTQQMIDGQWRSVPGTSDLMRNQHQQEVLLELAKKLRTFESPTDLSSKIEELSKAFVVDEGLGVSDALSLGWSLRDIDVTTIQRLVIPVKLGTTNSGQSILRATQPFDEVLAEFYPSLLEDPTPINSASPMALYDQS
ncbi:MAG: LCP family protein [Actinomycetota bacterium]|nr:LCP family protein [Actinomycetota bacterium]